MKQRPILFNAAMVRAVLDGSKTQTRRMMKHQPPSDERLEVGLFHPTVVDRKGLYQPGNEVFGAYTIDGEWTSISPYGEIGDQLWVRETFFAYGRWVTRFSEKKGRDESSFMDMTLETDRIYQYDTTLIEGCLGENRSGVIPGWWKRPAIFMPRWAIRIQLEITGVRIERLQDISEEDARAEGVTPTADPTYFSIEGNYLGLNARESYAYLWDAINGAGSCDVNPYVWVIEFKRVPA